MKLAHGKGTLWVTTECDDNTIRISFRDDGPGIAEENLGRVFDPFFTTRGVGQGTGLGLSVCHGIISEHNGRIYTKSKFGKGATFIVELPVVAAEKQAESGETGEEHERNGGQKILVVDDEPVVLEFIRDALVGEGYVVETMNSAEPALAMIRKKEYSLILLDIKLPGMSGIEVYKYIQQESPSLVEKIVFITGDIMGPDTKEFLSRTKAHCIPKPFNHEQLTKEVARILSRTI